MKHLTKSRVTPVLAAVLMLLLSACQTPRSGRQDSRPTLADHQLVDLSAAGATFSARVAWLDEQRLVYISRSGIEVSAAGGQPTTLGGHFWQVSPAPGGGRIGYWGESGLGLATTDPLATGRMLWDTAGMLAWARGQVGPAQQGSDLRCWVEDIRWSPDGRQVAALLRAEGSGPDHPTAGALAVFDANSGERVMLWGRSGREGSIRAFNWHKMLLVQYDNFPDGAGPHGQEDTSTLLLLDGRDPNVRKTMAGALPYPLTLADVQGSTALFLPDRRDYTEPFPKRPYIASIAMVGVTPTPVGEEGQMGLLSPRDGQFVPLGPGQERAAISPAGERLALLVPQQGGTYAVRMDQAPAPAAGSIDLENARPVSVKTAPAPAGDGPPPQLTDVAFATLQEGFGVTFDGAIYRSGSGGRSWTQLFRADGVELSHIKIAGAPGTEAAGTPAALFATGQTHGDRKPVLVASADGGETWVSAGPQGLPEDAARAWPYLNFTFLSREAGFAVPDPDTTSGGFGDARASLLATHDSGRHWEALPLPAGFHTSGGISFVTPDRGFITAFGPEGSQILATADGGRTWKAVYTSKVGLYSLQFLDGKQGFAGGGNAPKYGIEPFQYLLSTRDGGATWEEAYRSEGRSGGPIAALRFSSASTGWAALGICTGGASRPCGKGLVYTRDGGRTWQGRGGSADGWSAAGASAWGVIGDPQQGQAMLTHSADGGSTWRKLWHPAAVAVQYVHLLDARTGWLQTNTGLYRTADGGQSWQPASFGEPAPAGAWPVFAGGQTAYVPAYQNLLRSEDGGRTWGQLSLPSQEQGSVNRLAFAGPTDGWAAYTGKLYATHDGGQSWERLSPGLTDYLSTMAFGDALHGVAAGGRSLLLTSDGGKTWSGRPLKDVSLTAADYGPDGQIWLAGQTMTGGREDGILLHSPDGGRTWITYRGQSFWPYQVSFADAENGWLAAYAGGHQALLVTHDGGATWQQVWPVLPGPA